MIKTYVEDDQNLSFQIVSDDLKFINITTLPAALITSLDLKYINNSIILSFNLNDYDERIPILTTVLEFFNETGGVF